MGKIASKCCKPCEANNELGNANLEQTAMIIENNSFPQNVEGFAFRAEKDFNNLKYKAKLQEQMNCFIEKHKCNFNRFNNH